MLIHSLEKDNLNEETECSKFDEVANYFKIPTGSIASIDSFLSLLFEKVANFFNNGKGGRRVVNSIVANFWKRNNNFILGEIRFTML